MLEFLTSREGAIAIVAITVLALIVIAARGGRRAAEGKGGDGAVFPFGADTGSGGDCGAGHGGDSGGCGGDGGGGGGGD